MGCRAWKKRVNRKIVLLLLIAIMVFYKLMADLDPPDETSTSGGTAGLLRRKGSTPRPSLYFPSGHLGTSGTSRTAQYCNSPFEPLNGTEGMGPEGFKLEMVHVFIRHGDRTPIFKLPGYSQGTFDCNFRKWYPKHGDNEYFRRFPTHMDQLRVKDSLFAKSTELYPNKDICDEQSLTCRGALQHLKLGQFLNERYLLRNNLPVGQRSTNEQFHVRSTRTQRTIQSAVAFMYGFLPAFHTSNLSLTWSNDSFMCVERDKLCRCYYGEKLQSIYTNVVEPSTGNSSWRAESLAKMLNVQSKHVRRLAHVMDVFLPSLCHSKATMCSNKPPFTCVDHAKVEYMWQEYIDSDISRTRDPERNVLKYSYLHLYPVLREIERTIKENGRVESRSTRKFTLFSGHDTTIMPLLIVLGVHDGMWTPYASRVVFELYGSAFQPYKGKHYLRILYNGNDVTNGVTFCKGRLVRSLCDFDRFTEFMSSTMYELFKKTNIKDVCEMKGI